MFIDHVRGFVAQAEFNNRAMILDVARVRGAARGGEDGRKAVVLGHAAWRSLHENRPVKIAEFD